MSADGNQSSAGCDVPCDEAKRRREGHHPLSAISRRRILAFTSSSFLCAVGVSSHAAAGEAKPVDIGTLSDFPSDGIFEKFTGDDFFVIRREGRLYAVTSICTHMGKYLFLDPQDSTRIKCSGHESVFDNEGRVVVGPASQNLGRFGIALNAKDHVVVNPERKLSEDQWNDKGSYVAVK